VRIRLDLFQRAHELYRKRRWEDAQKSFQTILDKWPGDGPSRAYWSAARIISSMSLLPAGMAFSP